MCPPRSFLELYFNKRFTTTGDTVLATTFEENNLSSTILETGRHLFALVSDEKKKDETRTLVDDSCSRAIDGGWFDVTIDAASLPQVVPPRNHSTSLTDQYLEERGCLDDDGEGASEAANDVEAAFVTARSISPPVVAWRLRCQGLP